MRRGYVDTPNGQVHYRVVGEGPDVLLLHQSARTGAIYGPLARLLAPRHRVVMMDLPGFGASDPIPAPFEVSDIAGSAIALMDRLRIDAARVSGHHSGATIAVELAASHPGRVIALAPTGLIYLTADERRQLMASAPGPHPIVTMGGHTIPISRQLDSDGSHLIRLFQRAMAMLWHSKLSLGLTGTLMLPFENLPPEDLAFVNAFVMDGLTAISTAPDTLAAVGRYDIESGLRGVRAPTLFIRSTGPLESAYFQRAEMLRELVPGSRAAAIENGDIHMIHTRAAELSVLLLEFFSHATA